MTDTPREKHTDQGKQPDQGKAGQGRHTDLDTWLARESGLGADAAAVIATIATVAAQLARRIARGPLADTGPVATGANADGDQQQPLDVIADQAFAEALRAAPVRWYASEERETAEPFDPAGTLAVALDPLDGSSNIAVNAPIGTIFSLRPARDSGEASFLAPGREQLAAGYIIYGPQTALVVATRTALAQFTLDPESGRFLCTREAITIAPETREFAINASNWRHWPAPIRTWVEDCLAGEEGPREKNYNMRWVASLVAEVHRILTRGGVFLYPADARPGYGRGRLRMVYECAPVAFIIEQAGGRATDGEHDILDLVPESLHARTPFVFGAAEEVRRIAACHDSRHAERAPLFGKRGLFTA